MGYLLHILLALASVVAAESGLRPWTDRPELILFLLPVPHAAALAARRLALRGRFRAAGWIAVLCASFPPLGQALAVQCGWHGRVLGAAGIDAVLADWIHPALLASLAPFVVLEVAAIDARSRLAAAGPRAQVGQRRFHLRLFLTSALPLVVVALVTWAVSRSPEARVLLEEVGLVRAAATGLGFLAIALVLPHLLAWCWETSPLLGREHPWQAPLLRHVADRAGFRYRELRTWRTGFQVANAAIVGFLPWHRFVLFTDLLLAQLGPRELVAVFGHEVGHARRYHVAIFASWAVGYLLGVDLMLGAAQLDPDLDLVLFGALMVVGAVGFAQLSRRFELEADLESLELTGDPYALAAALETVGGGHTRHRRSWRHYSVEERVAFLERASADPAVGHRLRGRLGRLRVLGLLLLAATGGAQLVRLGSELPDDRLWADLRLGRFEQAARAAAERDDVPEELAALVERAAARGAEGDGGGEWWALEAVRALRAGDEPAARENLKLAVLRGQDRLRVLLEALLEEPAEDWPPALRDDLLEAERARPGKP